MEVTMCECADPESINEAGGQCAACACEQFAYGGIQQSFLESEDEDGGDGELFSYA